MRIEWKTELEKSKTWWVSRSEENAMRQQQGGGSRESDRKFSHWASAGCYVYRSFGWKRHAVLRLTRRLTKSSKLSVETHRECWKRVHHHASELRPSSESSRADESADGLVSRTTHTGYFSKAFFSFFISFLNYAFGHVRLVQQFSSWFQLVLRRQTLSSSLNTFGPDFCHIFHGRDVSSGLLFVLTVIEQLTVRSILNYLVNYAPRSERNKETSIKPICINFLFVW